MNPNRLGQLAAVAGLLLQLTFACGDAVVGRKYDSANEMRDVSMGAAGTPLQASLPTAMAQGGGAWDTRVKLSRGGTLNQFGYTSSSAEAALFPATGGRPAKATISSNSGTSATTGTMLTGGTVPSSNAPSVGGESTGGSDASDVKPPTCPAGAPVASSEKICADGTIKGDVDCNGVVNAVDALVVAQRAQGIPTAPIFEALGDIDCDGCLTEADATLISRISVGYAVDSACP